MKRKHKRAMLNTTINAFLSLNVQVTHQGEACLFTWSLVPLTWLLVGWFMFSRKLRRWQRQLDREITRLNLALSVSGKLISIGLHSALFGLGVSG